MDEASPLLDQRDHTRRGGMRTKCAGDVQRACRYTCWQRGGIQDRRVANPEALRKTVRKTEIRFVTTGTAAELYLVNFKSRVTAVCGNYEGSRSPRRVSRPRRCTFLLLAPNANPDRRKGLSRHQNLSRSVDSRHVKGEEAEPCSSSLGLAVGGNATNFCQTWGPVAQLRSHVATRKPDRVEPRLAAERRQ